LSRDVIELENMNGELKRETTSQKNEIDQLDQVVIDFEARNKQLENDVNVL
jgi:hypothetical protein